MKFSHDESAKGQLIFSTRESNLLDQETFRTDEIWFAEKNMQGSTKLYRREPDKEGKLYFMFCEGEKRETTYFRFSMLLRGELFGTPPE